MNTIRRQILRKLLVRFRHLNLARSLESS